MARTPETVSIRLHTLMQLLNLRWTAVKTREIGELGDKLHEDLVAELDAQSQVNIKPLQLADLIHHMREVIFQKVAPQVRVDYAIKNHNTIMRQLKAEAPHLFKLLPTGEVVMHELEDKNV